MHVNKVKSKGNQKPKDDVSLIKTEILKFERIKQAFDAAILGGKLSNNNADMSLNQS